MSYLPIYIESLALHINHNRATINFSIWRTLAEKKLKNLIQNSLKNSSKKIRNKLTIFYLKTTLA